MPIYSVCRFCRKSLIKVLDLGYQPLANDLLTNSSRSQATYPLVFCVCESCGLAQVPDCPSSPFHADYPYYSSINTSYVTQCREWAKSLELDRDSKILEIACNDGYLLKSFHDLGYRNLWGIEPIERIAKQARKYCKQMDMKFFNESFGSHPLKQDVIICNNVLAHIPDLNGFIRGLKGLLSEKGFISVEVPDLSKLVGGLHFDTIYHEHYSYFWKGSAATIFSLHGLGIDKIEEIPSHGGSLRIRLRHGSSSSFSYNSEYSWGKFERDVFRLKCICLDSLYSHKLEGKTIAAFGAAAKGATFLNFLGLKTDVIDYVIDETPYKIGKLMPGSAIPIKAMDYMPIKTPDYILILPWNFSDEIRKKLRKNGYKGKFLFRKGVELCEA